ncbi:MAG: hypothetical protein AB9903_28010 [Vulcanimicrobiota bacterium]
MVISSNPQNLMMYDRGNAASSKEQPQIISSVPDIGDYAKVIEDAAVDSKMIKELDKDLNALKIEQDQITEARQYMKFPRGKRPGITPDLCQNCFNEVSEYKKYHTFSGNPLPVIGLVSASGCTAYAMKDIIPYMLSGMSTTAASNNMITGALLLALTACLVPNFINTRILMPWRKDKDIKLLLEKKAADMEQKIDKTTDKIEKIKSNIRIDVLKKIAEEKVRAQESASTIVEEPDYVEVGGVKLSKRTEREAVTPRAASKAAQMLKNCLDVITFREASAF